MEAFADVGFGAAVAVREAEEVVGVLFRGDWGLRLCLGGGGEGFLADGAEFGVDDGFVFDADAFEVGPEAFLDVFVGAGEGSLVIGVLAAEGVAEVGFHEGGAVLEAALEIGDRAQELGFVDGEVAFPFLAPFLPVECDVGEFAGAVVEGFHFGADIVDFLVDGVGAGVEFVEGGGDGFERTVGGVKGFDCGLEGVHLGAVEFDLLADVPIENAGEEAFPGLDEIVLEARRAWVDCADGGDFGFGGVAGMDERE